MKDYDQLLLFDEPETTIKLEPEPEKTDREKELDILYEKVDLW
jgi:hypothetical protein